ncbi:hypothetical protein ACFV0O_00980 [Kitasatospora sp. NPDC059577]|uniref:hypothetical protein n=1 Tax=Kitasatospora sp. NPDC059577 TaxID=3346873 RepID=UPI0036D185EA
MPKILRVELTSDQGREVRERLRARDLAPGARLRLECTRLMGRGLTVRDLYFLDQSGFAPTMPTGYTWSRAGQRAVVPREDKKDRA